MDYIVFPELQAWIKLKSLESGLIWLFIIYLVYSYLRKRPRKRIAYTIVGLIALTIGSIYAISFLLTFSTLVAGVVTFNYSLDAKVGYSIFQFSYFVIGYFLMKMGSNLLRWRMRKIMGVLVAFAGLLNTIPYFIVGNVDQLVKVLKASTFALVDFSMNLALLVLGLSSVISLRKIPFRAKADYGDYEYYEEPSGVSDLLPPLFANCAFCGKRTFMPYRCNYCGQLFCSEHRLPPKHNCSGIDSWKDKAPPPSGVTWRYSRDGVSYRK